MAQWPPGAVGRPHAQLASRDHPRPRETVLADLRRETGSLRELAALMGRSPSTISRELRRGADAAGRYRPSEAHRRALGRRRVHRPGRLARDAELRDWVTGRRRARSRPEQVSRGLRRQYPDQPTRWLCAETIYQAVYRPDLGGLPRELPGRVLRHRRRHRLPRRDARARRAGPVTGMTLIHDRPAEALGRVEPGHWEGDLIVGAGHTSAIVTMVERTTRYTLLGHLPGARRDAATVRDVVVAALRTLPPHLRRTLTWDQGTEMARHAEIAAALGTTSLYFCDPHSPWQRPTNENTNGLLRDYFPKGTDLSVHTADDIGVVEAEVNRRPRKVLGWDSPADRMATLLGPPSVLRR
jgi:IS30 family transposase